MSASASAPSKIFDTEDGPGTLDEHGHLRIETRDGGLLIRPNWRETHDDDGDELDSTESKQHTANLALRMTDQERYALADDLLRGIQADEVSREDWLNGLARAVEMLGTVLKKSGQSGVEDAAPMEGMSSFDHPLLIQAVIRFQADFVSEMLPADGPVKIRNDLIAAPPNTPEDQQIAGIGDNGGPPLDDEEPPPAAEGAPPSAPTPDLTTGDLAQDLEAFMNYYLTNTASEYYPDHTRMGFRIGLMGGSVVKVFDCPLRKRPVCESDSLDNLIVDIGTTDIQNAQLIGRVTHRIKMQPSMLRRMVKAKVFRKCDLTEPGEEMNALELAERRAQGLSENDMSGRDYPHIVYECSTGLDPDDVADGKNADDGVYLPYKVTIEKTSRQVLAVRRNWEEDDPLKQPREEYVKYSYVDGLGFYPIGLFHILGNTVKALTAAFRVFLDSGMFANFPGFLYADTLGKQISNEFRVPPGGGAPVQTGGKPIGDMTAPLPYKDIGQAFLAFIQHLEQSGRSLGGEVSAPLMEGRANMPVGTMLAAIEQSVKPMRGVFKGLHRSDAQQFQLLKRRFMENPEALWKWNKNPKLARRRKWEVDTLRRALSEYDLTPAADPNTVSQVQRIAIAGAVFQAATQVPMLFQERETMLRLLRMINWPDPEGTLKSQQDFEAAQAAAAQANQKGSAQSDPALNAAKVQQAQASAEAARANAQKAQSEAGNAGMEMQNSNLDRQQKSAEAVLENQQREADRNADLQINQMKMQVEMHKMQAGMQQTAMQTSAQQQEGEAARAHEAAITQQTQQHEQGMAQQTQQHEQGMAQQEAETTQAEGEASREHEMATAKLGAETQKSTAKMKVAAKPKAKPASKAK